MKFLSVCSGIEAASVAFRPLGWKAWAFSEIEPFPSAVLAHHYPDIPNLGDMTNYEEWPNAAIDLLCGGTPCQSFSVAGLRRGLADERGNLSLTFCNIADKYDPEWVLWENVPGVLSSKDNAFGCFLAGLVGADEPFDPRGRWPKWGVVTGPKRTAAWRVLDAQFFGVAQRRRRVFVLASRGFRDWRSAAALFPVGESLFWDSAPSRESREGVTGTLSARSTTGGGLGTDLELDGGLVSPSWPARIAPTLNAAFGDKQGLEDQHALGGAGLFVPSPIYASDGQAGAAFSSDCALTLTASNEQGYVAFTADRSNALTAHNGQRNEVAEVSTQLVVHSLAGSAAFAQNQRDEVRIMEPGMKQQTCIAFDSRQDPVSSAERFGSLGSSSPQAQAVAVSLRGREGGGTAELSGDVSTALRASQGGGDKPHVLSGLPRRLHADSLAQQVCRSMPGRSSLQGAGQFLGRAVRALDWRADRIYQGDHREGGSMRLDYTYRTKAERVRRAQLSLALAQGHEGAERAADKADRLGDDWTIRAAEALREYAKLAVGPFTIEKAREHCPPVPEGADARAWGHVTRRAVRLGWIERLPGLFAPAVSSNGSPKPMYRAGPNA